MQDKPFQRIDSLIRIYSPAMLNQLEGTYFLLSHNKTFHSIGCWGDSGFNGLRLVCGYGFSIYIRTIEGNIVKAWISSVCGLHTIKLEILT